MIVLDMHAVMQCDVANCGKHMPARVVLLAGGGFGALPESAGWQVGKHPQSGAFVTRCPGHQVVIAPPVIQDAGDGALVTQ